MRDLLRANTYRLPRSGAFRVCTLAVALLSVYVCVNQKLESAAYDFVVNVDKLVFGFPVVLIGPALAIFTCFFVGVEHSDGVVRNKLTTGHSRGEVYLANFITCVEVGVFLELVSMALLAALGGPLFGGFQMEPGLLAMALLNSLLLTVCWAALFNMLAMLISNRTVNAVVSVLLVVLLFMAAVAILETLQAPEFVTSGEFIDGQVVLSELPNPRYLLPEQRAPYEWAMCLLPTGQVLGIAGLAAPYPIRMVMIALAETVLFDLVGLWGFRRKDLK